MKKSRASYQYDPEKPFDLCLYCDRLGKGCSGPNLEVMSIERWCEWSRSRKDLLGWTNQYIADKSDVSINTVDRIMSGKIGKDLKLSTACAVTKVLVNGDHVKYPCAMAAEEIADSDYKEEIKRLRAELAETKSERQSAVKHVEEVQQEKVDYLKAELKDAKKLTIRYRIAVIVFVALIFLLLLIDAALPTVGWFRY